MNRRWFIGSIAAALAAPKVVAAPAVEAGLASTFDYEPLNPLLPQSVAGRFECIADWLEQGFITPAEAARLLEIPAL